MNTHEKRCNVSQHYTATLIFNNAILISDSLGRYQMLQTDMESLITSFNPHCAIFWAEIDCVCLSFVLLIIAFPKQFELTRMPIVSYDSI